MIYVNKTEKADEHFHGTKMFVYPSKSDSQKLWDFITKQGIKGRLVKPSQYHCTVVYSSSPCPGAEKHPIKIPVVGSIYGYRIFAGPLGRCLVGLLHSPEIRGLNRSIVETFGATSNFPSYIPHLTLAWDVEGDGLPDAVMNETITFDAYKVAGIDPNWTPTDLDKE
jgi:hypothetical protein